MNTLARLIFILLWIAGIVIASGFWSTVFAITIPLWSYYLVVELCLKNWGLL